MRLTLLFVPLITLCLVQTGTLTGCIVRVADGDSIVILDAANAQQKIRHVGIHTPEKGQPFCTKLKDHLSALVADHFVVVKV